MVVQTVETITKEILDSYVDQAARAAGYEKGVRRAVLRLIASGMVGGILPTVSGPADAEQPAAGVPAYPGEDGQRAGYSRTPGVYLLRP